MLLVHVHLVQFSATQLKEGQRSEGSRQDRHYSLACEPNGQTRTKRIDSTLYTVRIVRKNENHEWRLTSPCLASTQRKVRVRSFGELRYKESIGCMTEEDSWVIVGGYESRMNQFYHLQLLKPCFRILFMTLMTTFIV